MAADLTIYEFGRQLIETKDLDPVYVVVQESGLTGERLHRWLLCYWCFYHVGTASWALDQLDYWKAMETAAGSKEYPRSSERRHFRGAQAVRGVAYLKSQGVEALFAPLLKDQPAEQIISYVQTWKQFGPWIAFKVADMVERLGLAKVPFQLDTIMYDSPRKAAENLWDLEGQPSNGFGAAAGEWAVGRILEELGDLTAPPRYERAINAQEAETILCKHGSYLKGHYHVGKDVAEVRHGLERFSSCKTAQRLLRAGEQGGLWL